MRKSVMVVQNKGDDCIISLPERADQEERKAHKYGSFVVQFHKFYILRLKISISDASAAVRRIYFSIFSSICQIKD